MYAPDDLTWDYLFSKSLFILSALASTRIHVRVSQNALENWKSQLAQIFSSNNISYNEEKSVQAWMHWLPSICVSWQAEFNEQQKKWVFFVILNVSELLCV